MTDERTPPDESQEHNLNPQPSPLEGYSEPSSLGLKIMVVLFVLIAGAAVGYGWLQHDTAQELATERADLSASLNQARSQEDALTAKVNALSAAQAQEETTRAQTEAAENEVAKNEQFPPRTSEATPPSTHRAKVRRARIDDPRWKQVQQQLGDQRKELTESQKQIAETQSNLQQAKSDMEGNLQSARTDLGTDIARNHEELVTLEKKGERNYYEFSFERSKTYHHTGPISIALHKADTKHGSCDLQMLVDDREITRKHVNLYESLTLHPEGYPQPVELVINRIDKDSVHGYVSEPKYRATEQTAAPASPAPTTASVTPPALVTPDASLGHREEGAH